MKTILSVSFVLALNFTSMAQLTPAITERGPHHRTWSRVASDTNRQGQIISVTNVAYVELATGMHFQDPATAQWTESEAQFEITPQSISANVTYHLKIALADFGDEDFIYDAAIFIKDAKSCP